MDTFLTYVGNFIESDRLVEVTRNFPRASCANLILYRCFYSYIELVSMRVSPPVDTQR
jgi:hypothetical protein